MENPLDQYVSKVRETSSQRPRGEAEERVESILTELQVPWTTDPAGDLWTVASDLGDVLVGLSDDDSILSIWQLIHPLKGKVKREAGYLAALLRINEQTRGSCFALTEVGDEEWVMIVARLAATSLDKEELSLALEDVFASLKLYAPDGSA